MSEATVGKPESLEALGEAEYLEQNFDAAIEIYERCYAAYRDARDDLGSVRVAGILGWLNAGFRGDGAVMAGWLARAQTLLGDSDDTAAGGWVQFHFGQFEGDRSKREQHLHDALVIARRFRDTDLEFGALAYLGASMVHDDRIEEGMMLLDEALAAVAGGEVRFFMSVESIFCQLFTACEYAHDIGRADQWIRVGEEIATRRHLPAVAAHCRTHYGGLLTSAGRWAEANTELTEAARIWSGSFRSMRSNALLRLAELRVRQGRFEEAEQFLEGLELYHEAAWSIAAMHLERGDTTLAADVLERALGQVDPWSASSASLWALLADVHLTAGALQDAGKAADRLEAIADRFARPFLRATAALARGRVCLATGSGDPRACLREALSGFSEALMPMELANSRLELARALTADRPEVAVSEAKAALEAYERLEAARHADAAAALLRSLGAAPVRRGPGAGVLTKREAEILQLLAQGLSNPEIADRLYITRKTVEHHVGKVLSKLGLRSRAEAAAHAARAERQASS